MLKSILSAIASGLMSALRFTGRVLSAPLRLFGGGGLAVPPEVPMPEPIPVEDAPDRAQLYDDIARIIMSWAADSIIADGPVPLPPLMPIALREWLPGLSRDECWELMEADKMSVSGHIMQLFPLPGVRPVQRLPSAVAWPAEPVVTESAGFAALTLLEETEPPRA